MICKKCGATMPDDGIFCSRCGERNDGKKPCPKCGELVDETAVFCSHCGERLDGKKVCPQCGALNDGNFCSVCGENLNYTDEKRTPNSTIALKREIKPFRLFCVNGVNYLDSVFALLGLLLMSVFSFFVGFNVVSKFGSTRSSVDVSVYYFFAEIYDSVPAGGVIINRVIGSIIAGIILFVPTSAFILSAFKFLLDTTRGKKTDSTMLTYGTLSIFFVCVFILFSRISGVTKIEASDLNEGMSVTQKLNIFCYLGTILPLVMFVISSTTRFLAGEKNPRVSLKDGVTSFLGICIIILLFVSVIITSYSPIKISVDGSSSFTGGTFSTFLAGYSEQSEPVWEGCLHIAILGDFIYVFFALFFIAVTLSVIEFIKNKKTSTNKILLVTLAETILAVGILVYYLIFFNRFYGNQAMDSIIAYEYNMNCSVLIVSLVFAALSFLIAIACQFIRKNNLFEK